MRECVNRYLQDRRQAGYSLQIEGEQLVRFAHFAEQQHHQGPMTRQLAIQWATASRTQRRLTAARRIEVLRPFARYCQQFDPTTEIPPRHLFGPGHRRLQPHLYQPDEIDALMAACDQLHPPGGLRGQTCAMLFGLMAATGLRVSEATGLRREDVDLEQGLLLIRQAKQGKTRWVPVHETTREALVHYTIKRNAYPGCAHSQAFFVFDGARPVTSESLRYAFQLLRKSLKWQSRGGHPQPRLHDLRHTFICRRLEYWYAQGLDINRHILALSTYVGHAKVTDTYWYVTGTPELLAMAGERFQQVRGGES
jgi:integrase